MPYESWAAYYQAQAEKLQVPESFVARTFLSKDPVPLLPDYTFLGRRILDLGCGDGRHTIFFRQLGMKTSGCEIAPEQVTRLREKFPWGEFREGRSSALPYLDDSFDYVAAINSIYYLDPDCEIKPNLAEAARVTRTGGVLVLSFVGSKHFILKDGERHLDRSVTIRTDQHGIRNGMRIRPLFDFNDLRDLLSFDKRLSLFQWGEIVDWCAGRCRHLYYCTVLKV